MIQLQESYHKAVLVAQMVQYLAPRPQGLYVDATFGGGGHTRALLEAEPTCRVIALDWDKNAFEYNAPALEQEFGERFTALYGSFSQIGQLLKKQHIYQVDGILADFGTSQYQIGHLPGFSFTLDTPLDMRMSSGFYKTTAYDVVNKASEAELATIFYDFGQEYQSRKIARALVAYRRQHGPIRTTHQLADIILRIIPRYSRTIHPATKVFQALRIFINDELNHIKSLLAQSRDLLAPEGRIVCISFHSLEDRLVKQFFKNNSDIFAVLTPKAVTAEPEELAYNKSARSAKLRAAQKRAIKENISR